MEALILFNIIGLSAALAVCTLFFLGWIKAEKKLAKHGESSIFGRRGKK